MDSVQDMEQRLGRVSWASRVRVLAATVLRASAAMEKAVTGHLLGLYFVCQVILGLLFFSRWGLFTEPFGLVCEKKNLVLPFFFFFPPQNLTWVGTCSSAFWKPLTEEKWTVRKREVKSQSVILVIKSLEVIEESVTYVKIKDWLHLFSFCHTISAWIWVNMFFWDVVYYFAFNVLLIKMANIFRLNAYNVFEVLRWNPVRLQCFALCKSGFHLPPADRSDIWKRRVWGSSSDIFGCQFGERFGKSV